MANPPVICSTCGATGRTMTVTPGSFLIELLLWCFFLLPGLIYSIWRLTQKRVACGACGGPTLIPLNSPRGQQLQRELGIQPGR